jgi:hypothetical protein
LFQRPAFRALARFKPRVDAIASAGPFTAPHRNAATLADRFSPLLDSWHGTKLASEIKAGDAILLRDGMTEITVTEVTTDLRSYVQISWLVGNERRFENFHKDDRITVGLTPDD